MFYFKACPKCKGDMHLDRDAYGSYRKCIQCGRIIEMEISQPGTGKVETEKLAA